MTDSPAPPSPLPVRRGLVVGLLVVAAALRLWQLGSVPPGLFRDEAEKGYTAWELWRTGRHGEFAPGGEVRPTRLLPLFVEAGGVQTSAIYQYLTAPIVGLFGLSVWSTRLVAAWVGTLTVLAVFFLARRIEQGAHAQWWLRRGPPQHVAAGEAAAVALAAMAFLAVSPTHVLFSRWAQQGITVPLFCSLGVLAVLAVPSAADKHRRALAALAGLLLAVAFYGYSPAQVVVPVILLGLWAEMGGDWRRLARTYWPAALLFLLFSVPIFLYAATAGSARFDRLSVFADRPLGEALTLAVSNYARHFDPRFLLLWGDANPRHGLPLAGLLAWAEAPFFLLGLATLATWRRPGARLLLVWLLAAPLAASLTTEGIPHALRSILLFPAVHLVSARGAGLLWRWTQERSPRVAPAAIGAACALTLVLTAQALFVRTARDLFAWQHGVLQALAAMDARNPAGPNVLSAEVPYAHYYVLFHEKPEPAAFHERGMRAARTLILAPGQALPEGALVARPPQLFERAQPGDITAPGDEETLVMMIRNTW